MAVASSASAMPGATTARLVDLEPAIAWNDVMMPTTVPKRPMKGADAPIEARKPSLPSSLSISRVNASSIALSMRVCKPSGARAPFSNDFFHSRIAATKIAPMPAVLRSESVRYSSSSDCPDQNTPSNRFSVERMRA